MDRVAGLLHQAPRIAPSRKILCIVCLASISLAGVVVPAEASAPGSPAGRPNLTSATLGQVGRNLVFGVRTRAPVALKRLDRTPNTQAAGSRYLCLALLPRGRRGERLLCLGGRRNSRHRAGLVLLNAAGKTVRTATLRARVKRPNASKLVLSLPPAIAGLTPRRYGWRALENLSGCRSCEPSLPARGFRAFRLRPVRVVGCTGGNAGLFYNGPRDRKVVALTFDDGPSTYTDDFVAVLRDEHAHATFFELGQEIAGRTATMRRLLRDGNEIGNHTVHHAFYPGYWDLAATNALIRSATHFVPCVFRPPGGGVNSAVVAAAGEAGLKTIIWDVDPVDWSTPGSGAVYSRVVGAVQPGSIVIMHDGGGNRGGTLAALPAIIDTLRARGYRFATVTQLLGHRFIYRPYG
jgi:peptidoglycan/xylan/chitin deacetylase (PgdA/CDA1 family)